MQIFEAKPGIPFLQLFLSIIMFITVITCLIEAHEKSDEIIEDSISKEHPYRLSKDVIPRHYEIHMILDRDFRFAYVNCKIEIEILKTTKYIRLHSFYKNKFRDKIVQLYYGINKYNMIYRPERFVHVDTDIIELHFKEELFPNRDYVLLISFSSKIPDQEEENSLFTTSIPIGRSKRYTLLTNIQSIEARQLIPCWDEPAFRTTFEISINYHKGYVFWPYLPDKTFVKNGKNLIWKTFNILHPISTYQVMFILTNIPLTYLTSSIESMFNATLIRRPSMSKYMKFAENMINKILQSTWYNNIPITVDKINQVAIPSIQHDVIGKWKLIIYKESLVIYDEEMDSSIQKMKIAHTIAHAMTHQSIDNAISLLWWSHLWLNEGLATLFHTEILHEIFPHWQFLDLFVVQVQHESFRLDTMFVMKSLTYEVETVPEIKSIFSFPIYIKAPVILRMVQHIIGNNFKEIVRNYLNTYQTKSSTPDDLWAMMEMNTKLYNHTMKDIIKNWIKREGYPVVNIHRRYGYGKIRKILSIYQDTYYINDDGRVVQDGHYFYIPITLTKWKQLDFTNTMPQYWLNPNEYQNEITIPLDDNDGWIILNLKQTGYYRVKYDVESLSLISNYLRSNEYKKIHVVNRAQIIDDTHYFWMRGEFTYNIFLDLTMYLSQETDYVAWYPMFQIFRDLSYFLPFEESEPLKVHMSNILSTLLKNKLSYRETSDEDNLIKWLRQEAVRWACIFEDMDCLEKARIMLEEYLNDPIKNKLLPEWKEWTYCKGAITANADVLLELEELHNTTYINKSETFNYILCPRKSNLLITLLFKSLSSGEDRYPIFFRYSIFVDYAVKHIDEIANYFETYNVSDSDRTKLLCIIINHLYSEDQTNQIKEKFILDLVEDNLKKIETRENLFNVIKRRLDQVNYQKEKLKTLLKEDEIIDSNEDE